MLQIIFTNEPIKMICPDDCVTFIDTCLFMCISQQCSLSHGSRISAKFVFCIFSHLPHSRFMYIVLSVKLHPVCGISIEFDMTAFGIVLIPSHSNTGGPLGNTGIRACVYPSCVCLSVCLCNVHFSLVWVSRQLLSKTLFLPWEEYSCEFYPLYCHRVDIRVSHLRRRHFFRLGVIVCAFLSVVLMLGDYSVACDRVALRGWSCLYSISLPTLP